MKDVRYTFQVDNKRVKATFILVPLFIFLVFSCLAIAGYIRGVSLLPLYLPASVFSLILFIFLWLYGKYAMFGLEWQLCDEGLRILKNGQEIRFIPWEDIADIQDDRTIIDGRDNKRFAIPLPPLVRKDTIEKMYELKQRKLNPANENLRTTYFSKEPWGVKKFLLATFLWVVLLILTFILVIGYSILLGILIGLFSSLHVLKDIWLGVIAWILCISFLAGVFCFLYFDQRKWRLLEKLRNLFLGRENRPKW